MTSVDVHQHLWGAALIDALRARSAPPFLRGWTLHLDGEPPYEVDPAHHDAATRTTQLHADLGKAPGVRGLVSLSSPLGIEWLPPEESEPLLEAYHQDGAALPEPFGAWAAAGVREIDVPAVSQVLDAGFVGLQLPATALADAAGYARCAELLELLQDRDLPLFVHPGPAPGDTAAPAWWPALVPYVQQMHAAWFAFRAFGRARHPRLRVCFAMLAGLAPLHGERLAVRGGGRGTVDPDAFVETSSYGPKAVDSTVRALGVDVIVHGSDRPYAAPRELGMGEAAWKAFSNKNPRRLLTGKERPNGS